MSKETKITPITASRKPRHPMRTEMGDIWALERQLREKKREHESEIRDIERKFMSLLEALQLSCNVAPGTPIDTSKVKWMEKASPDPNCPYTVIDWSKET